MITTGRPGTYISEIFFFFKIQITSVRVLHWPGGYNSGARLGGRTAREQCKELSSRRSRVLKTDGDAEFPERELEELGLSI